MKKMTFLGSGSAFTVGDGNYQSNILLEDENNNKLLLDCGSDIRFSLYDMGLSYAHIPEIYISHLHADHAGGLEYMGFCRLADPACDIARLHISQYFRSMLQTFVLKNMLSFNGEIADLNTFFNVNYISKDETMQWGGTVFEIIENVHVKNNYWAEPSFGLMFLWGGKRIFITTDTGYFPEHLIGHYLKADIIFHDCETADYASGVHAHYNKLKELPVDIKKKIWLYHYQPGPLPDAEKEGFKGFVQKGQTFSQNDI